MPDQTPTTIAATGAVQLRAKSRHHLATIINSLGKYATL
jgi:hypothetical protein